MPDSDIPTEIERDLAGIEASIEADAPPLELSQRLQALSIHVGSTGLDRLRFLIARATVENRLGPDPPDRAEFVLGFGPTAGQSKKAAMGYS